GAWRPSSSRADSPRGWRPTRWIADARPRPGRKASRAGERFDGHRRRDDHLVAVEAQGPLGEVAPTPKGPAVADRAQLRPSPASGPGQARPVPLGDEPDVPPDPLPAAAREPGLNEEAPGAPAAPARQRAALEDEAVTGRAPEPSAQIGQV